MKICGVAFLFSLFVVNVLSQTLGQYNVNRNKVHVSGISAGSYMAGQMHIAFSSDIKGVGAIAGGPFYCAQGSVTTALTSCMTAPAGINVARLVTLTREYESSGDIDSLSNLAGHKVYIFSGTNDRTFYPGVVEKLEDYYLNFVSPNQILSVFTMNTGHAHITDGYGNGCTTSASPYINDCSYDQSGILLQHLYNNTLKQPVPMVPANLQTFNQNSYGATSFQAQGFVYVPTGCQQGSECGLHVAFHGCVQNSDNFQVGRKYVENAGYNTWAEANNIIILYPQASTSIFPSNPNACFDWWGYADADYATKNGNQMVAVKEMMDRLMSGTPVISPPTNLRVSNYSNTEVSLAWDSVQEASSYDVARNGVVVADYVNALTFTDRGLSTGTTYSYTVSARAGSGGVSGPSQAVRVTTTGPPPPLGSPVLSLEGVTSSTISLSWTPLNSPAGYLLTRNSVIIANISQTQYVDSNLPELTSYTYIVAGYTASGERGGDSNAVSATTLPGWTCTSTRANNYAHVQDGRAYVRLGYVYANGSDEYMGLYNVAVMNTLSEISENYYIIGECTK